MRLTSRVFSTSSQAVPAIARARIILFPGIYETPRYFQSITTMLTSWGAHVIPLHLGRMRAPVPFLAQRALDELADIPSDLPIIFLAHSKGSLVARAVLSQYPPAVHGLIALAAPWNGSTLARFFPSHAHLARLAPGGLDTYIPWTDARETRLRSRIYSIAPQWDPHIPQGSFLSGAHNITLGRSGHFRPLGDRQLPHIIARCLNELIACAPLTDCD
ncbi:esterase/lipase family protein [Trueperella sp. LYQ141]|uniref:esterase/lipase family protein n=1 Tax=Trueperella sp. LYQ141 TaxID=3391058 RepID=UPI003982ECF6